MTMENINRRIAALPVTTFAVAALEWRRHECDPERDVCGCVFRFNCTQCGQPQTTYGEDMPNLIDIGGKCEGCHYGIRPGADVDPLADDPNEGESFDAFMLRTFYEPAWARGEYPDLGDI